MIMQRSVRRSASTDTARTARASARRVGQVNAATRCPVQTGVISMETVTTERASVSPDGTEDTALWVGDW